MSGYQRGSLTNLEPSFVCRECFPHYLRPKYFPDECFLPVSILFDCSPSLRGTPPVSSFKTWERIRTSLFPSLTYEWVVLVGHIFSRDLSSGRDPSPWGDDGWDSGLILLTPFHVVKERRAGGSRTVKEGSRSRSAFSLPFSRTTA